MCVTSVRSNACLSTVRLDSMSGHFGGSVAALRRADTIDCMRVVHFLRSLSLLNGGPPRSVIDLATALAERGHHIDVLTSYIDELPPSWRGAGTPCVHRIGRESLWSVYCSREERALIRKLIGQASVLHLHECWDPLNLYLARVARASGVPYVVSSRGSLDDWCMRQKRLKKWLYLRIAGTRLLNDAAFVHATASGEAQQSERWYPSGRTEVIPNLINVSRLRSGDHRSLAYTEFGIDPTAEVLLFMGRIDPIKGIDFLLDSMPIIRRTHPRACLVIAGNGTMTSVAHVRRSIDRLGIEDCVRMIGFVRGHYKAGLLQCASAFVLPSSHENFGNAIFEAAACGVHCIVTRQVETWRELWAAKVATIVQQDTFEISTAVSHQLSLPADERVSQSTRAKQWTENFLNPEMLAQRYVTAYESARKR